jgi:hypothetical protein
MSSSKVAAAPGGQNGYSKFVTESLSTFKLGEVHDPKRSLYVPKPPAAGSFTNALVDALLDKVAPGLTPTILWKFGGKVFVFDTEEEAEKVRGAFPCELSYYGRSLRFELTDEPADLTGFKVRLTKLPVGTTKIELRRLAELFALNSDHVEEASLMLTRRGCPTDMGFLCYKVAPPFLLEHSKVKVGSFEITVVPLNREASCKECGGKCHTASQCPYKALEGWRRPTLEEVSPELEKGKEKKGERDSPASESDSDSGKGEKEKKKGGKKAGGKGGSAPSSAKGGGGKGK